MFDDIIELGLRELKSILGEDAFEHKYLDNLLRRHNGDVQRAINILLDQPPPRGPDPPSVVSIAPVQVAVPAPPLPPPLPKSDHSQSVALPTAAKTPLVAPVTEPPVESAVANSSPPVPAVQSAQSIVTDPDSWPKLLGVAHIYGLSLSRTSATECPPGCHLQIKRDSHRPSKKSQGGGKGGNGGKGGKSGGSKQIGRHQPAAKLAHGSQSKQFPVFRTQNKSKIIRFCRKDGKELGRLPPEWEECLAPLIDEQKVKLNATCAGLPFRGVGIMDEFPLRLSVSLCESAFDAASSAASLDDGDDAVQAAARRFAVVRLLSCLRLSPLTPPAQGATDEQAGSVNRRAGLKIPDVSSCPSSSSACISASTATVTGDEDSISDKQVRSATRSSDSQSLRVPYRLKVDTDQTRHSSDLTHG